MLAFLFLKLCTGRLIDGQSDVQMAGPLDIAPGKQKDPEIRTRISLLVRAPAGLRALKCAPRCGAWCEHDVGLLALE